MDAETKRMLNAILEEMGRMEERYSKRFDKIDERLDKIESRLETM